MYSNIQFLSKSYGESLPPKTCAHVELPQKGKITLIQKEFNAPNATFRAEKNYDSSKEYSDAVRLADEEITKTNSRIKEQEKNLADFQRRVKERLRQSKFGSENEQTSLPSNLYKTNFINTTKLHISSKENYEQNNQNYYMQSENSIQQSQSYNSKQFQTRRVLQMKEDRRRVIDQRQKILIDRKKKNMEAEIWIQKKRDEEIKLRMEAEREEEQKILTMIHKRHSQIERRNDLVMKNNQLKRRRFAEAMRSIVEERLSQKQIKIKGLCECSENPLEHNVNQCRKDCKYFEQPHLYNLVLLKELKVLGVLS